MASAGHPLPALTVRGSGIAIAGMNKHLLRAAIILVAMASPPALPAGTQLYWGDTHLHTSYSVDAYATGNDDSHTWAEMLVDETTWGFSSVASPALVAGIWQPYSQAPRQLG